MVAPTAHEPHPRPSGGIVTPEAVRLDFATAGLGSRSLGFVIDLGVRVGILWGVLTALAFAAPVAGQTFVVVVIIASAFAILLVYPVVCETFWNGRTVGKMLVGLRVVTVEGAPVRFRHAAIRSALGMVDFLVGAGSVAIISALATRQSQRLGDLAAGTIVIRERQVGSFSQPIVFHPPHGWGPYVEALDVTALDDDDYVLVRTFLLRVHEMRPLARAERASELARSIAASISVEVPTQHPPETFLVAVAAAYQRRRDGSQTAAASASFPPPAVGGAVPPPVWHEDQPPATWGTTPHAP